MQDKTPYLLKNAANLFVSFAFFAGILIFPLPVAVTSFFKWYSPLFFLTIFLAYAIIFREKNTFGKSASLMLTMVIFSLALSFMWTSGYSDNKIIGGLFPYKDAFSYYNGARAITSGYQFPLYSVQAARRPLFSGFLASLLFFTGNNLQISLAILVALLGYTGYLVGQKINSELGAFPAALYMAFFFLYAQLQIGFTHTELLGLVLGNLSLLLFWDVATRKKIIALIYALFITTLAISVRAGAFFVLPSLALWAGVIFDHKKFFSWKIFSLAIATIIFSYFLINSLYSRILVEPGIHSFGNFAYTLYGQVHGGAGWHRSIEELGTQDPEIIMNAAILFFKAHPTSLLIGAAKSYRDFFFSGSMGIFSFAGSKLRWLDTSLWIASLGLLILGLIRSIKAIKHPLHTLFLASFLGILFSIPFLPPIDGGKRFYASTIPFLFGLLAVALSTDRPNIIKWDEKKSSVALLSSLLALFTLVVPVFIFRFTTSPEVSIPSCPTNQIPYAFRIDPGSYIDIIPSGETSCGKLPTLCIDNFFNNGKERNIDLLFQEMVKQAEFIDAPTRIQAVNNLVPEGRFHFFIGETEKLQNIPPRTTITGCATKLILEEMKSRPVLYRIESVILP
jgi:hypothetical protein